MAAVVAQDDDTDRCTRVASRSNALALSEREMLVHIADYGRGTRGKCPVAWFRHDTAVRRAHFIGLLSGRFGRRQ